MKLESLNELLTEQLQDLYSVEQQIIEALPKMIEKASNSQLKAGLDEHLQQTKGQLARLDRIFDKIPDVDREDQKCKGMEGIIKEGEEIVKAKGDADVRDVGIISAAQRVEHYEIAVYGTARTYAQLLGRKEWAQLLQQTLDEEKTTDQKLTRMAETVNIEAKAA